MHVNYWAAFEPFDRGGLRARAARQYVCAVIGTHEAEMIVAARAIRRYTLSSESVCRLLEWAGDDHTPQVTRHDAYNGVVMY